MAFPEDAYSQPQIGPRDGPITTWDSNPLFTLLAQFGAGFILVLEWGIALAVLPMILPLMPPTGPIDPIGTVIMMLFVPVGVFQLYLSYRLYRREPNTLNFSFITSILVIVMTGIIIVSGIMTGTLSNFALPAIQIGINLALLYLTKLNDVVNHFERKSQQVLEF
ncbi:MAG: hypothetical protein ACW96M_07715 [Candidatus Thorarchaeota archaeon]|jgi:hypothetical protein